MDFSVDKNKIQDFVVANKWMISIFTLRFLLDFIFYVYLNPYYDYLGFKLSFDPFFYVISFLPLFGLFLIIPQKTEKVSDLILQFFFISVYLPFTSYFSLSGESFTWFMIFTFFWYIVAIFNYVDFGWKIIKTKEPTSEGKVKNKTLIAVLIVFGLIFIFSDLKFNFSILDVYGLREENPTQFVPFSGYIINWTGKVFLPFLLIYAIVKKGSYFNSFSIFILGLILLLFSITGHKSYLFLIPAIYGTLWLLKTKNFYFNLILIFIAISIVGLIALYFFDNTVILSLFVRRTLFIPAQISFYYYDFFDGSPLYLSNSLFRYFYEYPYDLDHPYLIGKYYFNKPETSANNGIVADGFAHFGILGVFIWSFLFSLLLKVLDSVSMYKNKLVLWTLILLGARVFVGGGLFTTMLTHGFAVIILICYFYPHDKPSDQIAST